MAVNWAILLLAAIGVLAIILTDTGRKIAAFIVVIFLLIAASRLFVRVTPAGIPLNGQPVSNLP